MSYNSLAPCGTKCLIRKEIMCFDITTWDRIIYMLPNRRLLILKWIKENTTISPPNKVKKLIILIFQTSISLMLKIYGTSWIYCNLLLHNRRIRRVWRCLEVIHSFQEALLIIWLLYIRSLRSNQLLQNLVQLNQIFMDSNSNRVLWEI